MTLLTAFQVHPLYRKLQAQKSKLSLIKWTVRGCVGLSCCLGLNHDSFWRSPFRNCLGSWRTIFQLFLLSLLTYQYCKFSYRVLFYTSVTTNYSMSVWLRSWVSSKPYNLIQTLLFLDSKQLQQSFNWMFNSNHLTAQAEEHPAVQDAYAWCILQRKQRVKRGKWQGTLRVYYSFKIRAMP